jgi:hypothetical protein
MKCLSYCTRTGLLVMVTVLVASSVMPVIAGAAQEKAGSFDPFALNAMVLASAKASIAPADDRPTALRTPRLVIPERPKLRSPFRPFHPGAWQ